MHALPCTQAKAGYGAAGAERARRGISAHKQVSTAQNAATGAMTLHGLEFPSELCGDNGECDCAVRCIAWLDHIIEIEPEKNWRIYCQSAERRRRRGDLRNGGD